MKLVAVTALALLGACKGKSAESTAGSAAPAVGSSGSATTPVDATPMPSPIDDSGVAIAPDLPMAKDVLPPAEVSDGARVFIGPDYLFQVPASFKRTDRDGAVAYTGTVDVPSGGSNDPAHFEMTLWASSEEFTGDLDALVARETKAVTDAKATADVKPAKALAEQQVKDDYARQMFVTFADSYELRTLVVHKGKAYILHCATPANVQGALGQATDWCKLRGMMFDVLPGPLKKP